MRSILLTIALLLFYANSNATPTKYIVIKDLSNNWQVYEKSYLSYIPVFDKQTPIQSGGVFLDDNIDPTNFISFYSTDGLSLFVENKLVYKHPTGKDAFRARLPIEKLNAFRSQDRYLLLFHSNTGYLYVDSLYLQAALPTTYKESKPGWVETSLLRTNIHGRNVFIYSIIIFCVVLVFYKFVFMKGRTLINLGLDRNTELLLLDRSGMMSATLIIINALLYMIIFYVLLNGRTLYFNPPFKLPFTANPNNYIYYLFFAFCIMQLLKIIYIKIINELTFPSGVSPLQNYLLLNYLFQTGLVILPTLLFLIALFPIHYMFFIADYATSTFFVILVIISLLTSYMIYSRSELRNIYLFSYICTAEIVPLIIAYRFLLG
jgi:hypothetical protein